MSTSSFTHALETLKETWSDSTTSKMSAIGGMAEDAVMGLGRQLREVARNVADGDRPLGLESVAAFAAAHAIDRAGRYFEREGFSGAVNNLSQRVKQNPVPYVLAAIGLGLVVSGALFQRSQRNA